MPRSSDVGTPTLLLDPPVSPQDPRYPLKADENYQYMLSDAEVDRLARTQPHGRVTPIPGGRQAKCPGPRGCGVCRREVEILDWAQASADEKMRRQMEALRGTAEYRALASHAESVAATEVGLLDRVERAASLLLRQQAPVESIRAYFLHPLVCDDEVFAHFDPALASTPTVLMYALEYRNLVERARLHDTGVATSPLAAVNQMLAATRTTT